MLWSQELFFLQTLEILRCEDQQFKNCSLQSPSKGTFSPSPPQAAGLKALVRILKDRGGEENSKLSKEEGVLFVCLFVF